MKPDRCPHPTFRFGDRRLPRLRVRWDVVAFSVLASVALLAPASLPGKQKPQQQDYAIIIGTVWSPNNLAAPGVTVKIRPASEKKARWTLTSDNRGEFAQRVPVGPADYIVWAELPKHKTPVAQTTVHIDTNERADIGLHLTQ